MYLSRLRSLFEDVAVISLLSASGFELSETRVDVPSEDMRDEPVAPDKAACLWTDPNPTVEDAHQTHFLTVCLKKIKINSSI